jgi:hypothetical protein
MKLLQKNQLQYFNSYIIFFIRKLEKHKLISNSFFNLKSHSKTLFIIKKQYKYN